MKATELQPVGGPVAAPAAPVATATVAPSQATNTAATPSVPADWYKDPSGRFELRYWNGSAWTEHVATGGTQSTDAPR
jgi:hypothetical protein